jgi:glutamate synthase domain-containing protein 1
MPKLPSFKPRAEVGDVVYYISPNNCYAVKRAIVVEIKRSGCEYRQVMNNSDVVVKDAHSIEDNTTFASRDDAVQFIIASLIKRINDHKTRIASLQHELDVSERVLATLQKMYPNMSRKLLQSEQV